MVIPGLVVFDHALLDTFTGNRKRDVNLPVCTPLRRQHAEFDRRECRAGIPVRNIRQKFQRIVINHSIISAQSLFPVGYRTENQCPDIILRQTLQLKNDGSGQQSSVDLKIRILCRCTDQNDRAVLHERKQIILLPLIEAMNLIDKEDRLPAVHSLVVLRLRDHFLHVLLAGRSRIDL